MKILRSTFIFFITLHCYTYELSAINTEQVAKKNIVIFGAGYVGCVTGACLSKLGHEITFIDPDLTKIALLNQGKSPILEPHLEELLTLGKESGLIHAQKDIEHVLLKADIAMIAVQTPTGSDNTPQTDFIEDVLTLLQRETRNRAKPLIISIRSTIPPTLIRQLYNSYFGEVNKNIALVVNPEFLRESTAVDDFFTPPFCVVGGDDIDTVNKVLSLYTNITSNCVATSLETACLLKYACNAFHATKITFANEMATLSKSLGADPIEMMNIFCQDKILNCSSAYLKPGFSFGGSCLSKDLQALVSLGNSYENELPLLSAIIPSNEAHFERKAKEILQGNHQNLAILGVTFKKDSDDVRESPFLRLIDHLKNNSVTLHLYDPDLTDPSKLQIEHLLPWIQDDLNSVLKGCDGVVLCKDLLPKSTLQKLQNQSIPIYKLSY